MLEHAELAIAEADKLSSAPAVSKQDRRTKELLQVIEQLRSIWTDGDALPHDLKRLAQSIVAILKVGDVPVERLTDVLMSEVRRIGLLPKDLSPYSFAVQALANHPDLNFEGNLELPASMLTPHERIIVLQGVSLTAP
jgi:hypothetical protein